jgi:hypothetical protein
MKTRIATAGLLLAPLLTAVASAAPSTAAGVPAAHCALDGTPGLTTFRWTGAAGDSLWSTGGNWAGGAAPTLDDAATGYVCIDAAHDADATSSTVHVVPQSFNTAPPTENSPATSAMLQAIDVASGTLSVNLAGKLYLYGDPATRPSVVRPGAHLELTMGTIGGSGLLEVQGDMVWTAAQRGSSTLKSSCLGIAADEPGGQPGDPDTLPQYCPPAVDTADGRGMLRVSGSLSVRGGVLDAGGVLTDDGLSRGVSLAQRYRLQVAAGGEVRVLGNAYVAQSHTAAIEVLAGGSWVFAGDGDVVEGFFEGTPSGPLPPFVNAGTVTKASGSGASSIDTAYAGDGAVVVDDGALTTPGGFPAGADVAAGRTVGTWDCPQATFGAAATDCTIDGPADRSVTTPQDPQAAAVELPPAVGARVQVRETADQGTADLQPQVVVAAQDATGEAPARLTFEVNKAVRLPVKADIVLYRRAGAAGWRPVPACAHAAGTPAPRGVTACVRGGARDRRAGNGVVVEVETTRVRGRWVLRSRRAVGDEEIRSVVPVHDADGTTSFAYLDGGTSPVRSLIVSAADGSCGPRQAGAWSLHRVLEDPVTDDHSVGWHRSATGEARGFLAPVGDLAEVVEVAGSVRVESGTLRGFVRLERHETADVRWSATAEVTLDDARPAGSGAWRLVAASTLTYRWQRHVGGVRDQTPEVHATLEDFLADHAGKQAGAPPDTAGFAYGCTGEQAQQNDLVVRTVRAVGDPAEPETTTVVWDLEAPATVATFAQPTVGIGSRCQLARRTWPNVVRQGVRVTPGAAWVMEWAPTDRGPWRPLRGPGGAPAAGVGRGVHVKVSIVLPGQGGVVRVRVPTTDDHRKHVSTLKRFKAVPTLDLRRITRLLYVGRSVRLTGAVAPASARDLELWVVAPGERRLRPVRAAVRVAGGSFTITYRPPRTGRFGLAVRHAGNARVAAAMGREVFYTSVRRRPAPPPPPAPTSPPARDVGSVADDGSDLLDPIERGRAGACVYRVGGSQ